MPRSVKHGKRKVARATTNKKNIATAKKKALKKKKSMSKCASKEILNEWSKNKTLKQNLESMGLVYDANKAIPLCSQAGAAGDVEEMDIDTAKAQGTIEQQKDKLRKKKQGGSGVDPAKAARVIGALRREAKKEEKRINKGRQYRLMQQDVDFCSYMIQRHGDDYESMARDAKNLYQDTATQIKRKIRIFKQSPEYERIMPGSSS